MMRFSLFVLPILLGAMTIAAHQTPPSDPMRTPNPQERRLLASIADAQRRLDDLIARLAAQQAKLEELKSRLPSNLQLPAPKSVKLHKAIVLNISGGHFVISVGKEDGFVLGDFVLVLRRRDNGLQVVGKGYLDSVYKTDAVCASVNNWLGIRPEDEVYNISRLSSPFSIATLQWERNTSK